MREEFHKYDLKKFHQGLYNLKKLASTFTILSTNHAKLKESLCQGMTEL